MAKASLRREPARVVVEMVSPYLVTGAAIANCLGTDTEAVLDNAFTGAEAFVPARAFAEFPFPTVLGVMPVRGGDVALTCTPTRVAKVAFASVRQLLPAVRAAIDRWGAARVAYVFASSTGGLEQTERSLRPVPEDGSATVPMAYADHGVDATVQAIADYFGLAGICTAISTACSSSFNALASATRLLERGLADAVVVGGADSLCRTTVFGFHSLGLMSPTATRPFSRDRAGLTLGDGSAYIVLERWSAPLAARALAGVRGIGAATDAFHHTSPHPEGVGGQLCMRQALSRAELSPRHIDCVSAHGTGTQLNDASEAAAITAVFERPVPVTATKSLTGHTLGSAGLTALVIAIESLRRQEIPPTLRLADPDPALGMNMVVRPTSAALHHIIVNAFGFGGSNVSVVVSQV